MKKQAFTLVELMIVLVILGVLMAFFIPQMTKYLRRAKVTATKKALTTLQSEVEMYNTNHGKYPESLEAVAETEKDLKDAFGNEFDYNAPPVRFKDQYKHYEVISLGADGEESDDDLHIGN